MNTVWDFSNVTKNTALILKLLIILWKNLFQFKCAMDLND